MLRLHILPEFGVLVERVTISASDVPVVDTRKVDTIALVQDGQTVVLGGMRKKGVSKEKNKVPLLGDLPLLGALFSFEGEDTSVTELVVFIALDETFFDPPEPSSTRAEIKATEESIEE